MCVNRWSRIKLMRKIYLKKAKTQIARPTKIRDINKQIVLNYIRARSPISRAEIARETELQRSTVSSIVESLKKSKLIEEIGEGHSTGGRKPTMLKVRSGIPAAIGCGQAMFAELSRATEIELDCRSGVLRPIGLES